MSQPLVQVWVTVADRSEIALEVLDICTVKSDDSSEQSNIRFCDVW